MADNKAIDEYQKLYEEHGDKLDIMDCEVYYFSVNNWFGGRDYPEDPRFEKWVGMARDENGKYIMKGTFYDDEWVKANKLCVKYGAYDMSTNFLVTAPREWILENCPELLSDKEYEYFTLIGNEKVRHTQKYASFMCTRDDNGDLYDRFGWTFLEYKEENFGTHWYDEDLQTTEGEDET